jgi:hypothetical protein
MTNSEYRNKYPRGTRIRFVPSVYSYDEVLADMNKTGRIVGFTMSNRPLIVLSKSTHESDYSTEKLFVTWQTTWSNIKILPQKNQQLLFSFMYAE